MQPRLFLRGLGPIARSRLPAKLGRPHEAVRGSMVQLWYGNRALHYECWIRHRLAVIELGLHFEADPLTDLRLLSAFRAKAARIRKLLGPTVRIEEWDRGWARVWEPVPLATLDEELQRTLGERLGRYIAALEPILRDELPADVSWRLEPAPGS